VDLRSLGSVPVRVLFAAAIVLGSAATVSPASGFPHVVKQGETLAQIAERVYGNVAMERVLVSANGLDAGGGISIVRGMRLEVPALSHHRVHAGDTWASLAGELLGDAERADVLSAANDSSPWMTPSDGAEVIVPYNLRVLVGGSDTIVSVAQRYMGSKEKAWVLDRYNRLKGTPPRKGDVLLVPLATLRLTEEGKKEAMIASSFERSETLGTARDAQRKADAEIPALLGEVRNGRYIDAITRGSRLLTYGELTRPQVAAIHRQLLEAYVAVDARGHASSSCRSWREADPQAELDPVYLSPKIIDACEAAGAPATPSPASSRR
jgi:hypothetical protein